MDPTLFERYEERAANTTVNFTKMMVADVILSPYLRLWDDFGTGEGFVMACIVINLAMLAQLNRPKDQRPHFRVILWCWLIQVAGCLFLWSFVLDSRPWLFSANMVAAASSGVRVYRLYFQTIMHAAGGRIYEFLDLVPHNILGSPRFKLSLLSILAFDPNRVDSLYDEFRLGLEGTSEDEKELFLHRFFWKYLVVGGDDSPPDDVDSNNGD